MTKEELLSKGLSETDADEVIASFSGSTEESPLQSLEKALGSVASEEQLIKAEEGEKGEKEDEEDKEEYNEKYMKKHMKRYMKENQKSCKSMMKELGGSESEMKKAVEDMDFENLEAAVIETEDLKPILEKQMEFNSEMTKAISLLSEQIETISSQTEKNYDLMEKAAKVTLDQAKGLDSFLSVPNGRKGVVHDKNMQKATEFSPEQNKVVYDVLLKATKEGDSTAGGILSVFESYNKNLSVLNTDQRQYIGTLMNKEAK